MGEWLSSRRVRSDSGRRAHRFDHWGDEISNGSYRTLRDDSLGGRFPRHFVPGYDRTVLWDEIHSPRRGFD
jgi:hypothetical protein